MQEIRKEIQPIFQQIGENVCPFFTEKLDTPFICISHSTDGRSVYPPEETWAAFGPNKRVIRWMPTSRSVLLVGMLCLVKCD